MDNSKLFDHGLFYADGTIAEFSSVKIATYNLCFTKDFITLDELFRVVGADTDICIKSNEQGSEPVKIIRNGEKAASERLRQHRFQVLSAIAGKDLDVASFSFKRIVLFVSPRDYEYLLSFIYKDVSKPGTHVLELKDDCTAFIDFGQGVDVSVYLICHRNVDGKVAIIESQRFGFAKDYVSEESRMKFMNELRNNFKYE